MEGCHYAVLLRIPGTGEAHWAAQGGVCQAGAVQPAATLLPPWLLPTVRAVSPRLLTGAFGHESRCPGTALHPVWLVLMVPAVPLLAGQDTHMPV